MEFPFRILADIDQITRALLFMIKNARRQLDIVSPYIQLRFSAKKRWKAFDDAISEAIRRDVKISFVSRERDANTTADAMKLLKEYRELGCNVFLVPDLHAKIYWNETIALVTSMNLYYGSTIKNREIGVIIDSPRDHDAIRKYIDELKASSMKTSIDGGRVSSKEPAPRGVKEASFKVTGKGTKFYRIKLEGKYPGTIMIDSVAEVLVKGNSYRCIATIQWRTVGTRRRVSLESISSIELV